MVNENNGKTVLVVDDSEVMREMIKDALRDKGYSIAGEAKDGDEALVRYKEYQPSIVTMDVVNMLKGSFAKMTHDGTDT